MGEIPKGGLIGRTVHFGRRVAGLKIPLYAANAGFFIVLSAVPALLLLLGLLRYTPLEVEQLGQLLQGILPEALLEGAEELILTTYDATSGTVLGITALTALWSASRGIHGLRTGLNAVYGVEENRGWLHTRLLSAVYTVVFLLVILLTLVLYGLGSSLLELLRFVRAPFLRFLAEVIDLRFWLLLLLQSGVFTAMFLALPNCRSRLGEALPGAFFSSLGWLLFSKGYSLYVTLVASRSNVYGSVYAVTLSMLWLYWCICIVFYGGGLNAMLKRKR